MAKSRYVCKNCGSEFSKWYGKCPNCGEWGSLVEIFSQTKTGSKKRKPEVVKISQIDISEDNITLNGQFSSFFSGRILRGGVYLISGTPGVGKSTFLLQMADLLLKSGAEVLYVTAEESLGQIASRARRLNVGDMDVISEGNLETIIDSLNTELYDVVILDSVHTIYSSEIDSAVGGFQQVRYCAEKIIATAKNSGIAVFLVAHITKSGLIAGPKTLEHMVDAVILMEGDKTTDLRVVKFTKNRFGSTDEALILEMEQDGLKLVENPTMKFLHRREFTDGICYGATVEGKYPIVLEVQALCVQTPLAVPRRVSVGFDINRLNMLLAVLEKRLGIPFFKYDVYVNITGGLKVSSTSIDAAVATALISSIKKSALDNNTVAFSEIDLTGKLRLFERDKKVVEKLKSMGFRVLSGFDVKDVKELYDYV